MKTKDFQPIKTEKDFQRNYSLHDIAQAAGEEVLIELGFKIVPFGEDRRHDDVWEAGEDKPDCILINKEDKRICLLDWKGKKSCGYKINKRAYEAYLNLAEEMKLPLVLAFAKINEENKIIDFECIKLPDESSITGENLEWDKNITVIFDPVKIKKLEEIKELIR